MKVCQQTSGLSIYQHGLDVANRYRDLQGLLKGQHSHYTWSITGENLDQLKQINNKALFASKARNYHIFHDCGKPYCLTIDEQGKRHFPNHAAHSARIYREIFSDDEVSAQLIEMDMLCHTLRGEEAEEFAKHELAPTLLLTAWSELHANAQMFGGFDTDSFKIKRKQLTKLSKKIVTFC